MNSVHEPSHAENPVGTAQPLTPTELLQRLDLSSFALGLGARLVVMRQNPADHYHWSKPVGEFTAGEVRDALTRGEQREVYLRDAREALLDLIADARRFEEQTDGDCDGDGRAVSWTDYFLEGSERSLRALAEALGIRVAYDETAGDAITRLIANDATDGSASDRVPADAEPSTGRLANPNNTDIEYLAESRVGMGDQL